MLYPGSVFLAPGYICEITRHSKGIWTSRLRLYPDAFLNIHTITPPVKEQEQILLFIAREQEPVARLIGSLRRSIKKLHEYRASLITAAVTGQIQVPTEVF